MTKFFCSFSKRKYTDGVFVSAKGKGNSPETKIYKSEENNRVTFSEEETISSIKNNSEKIIVQSKLKEVVVCNNDIINSKYSINKTTKQKSSVTYFVKNNLLTFLNFSNHNKIAKIETRYPLLVPTKIKADVVEVILAIFLPAVGVYVHEGITTSFWISLILWVLWPIASIFAVLVVLDMINIK